MSRARGGRRVNRAFRANTLITDAGSQHLEAEDLPMRKPVKSTVSPKDLFERKRGESTLLDPAGGALLAAVAAVCANSCCDFCAGCGCGCCCTSWGGCGVTGAGARAIPLKVAIRQELPGDSAIRG